MENEKKYVCPFCGRDNFKNKSGLTQHIKHCKQNPNRVDSHMQGRKLSDETKRKISESGKIAQNKPEMKQKHSETSKKMWADNNARQKNSEKLKKLWKDETFKQKQHESRKIAQNKPEVKQKRSEISKKLWENPEYREKLTKLQKEIQNRDAVKEKISEASKKLWENPEYREKRNNALKESLNKPEVKQKRSENTKLMWENPEYREKQNKIQSSDEWLQKISESSKQRWEDPEYREKRYNTLKQNNSFSTSKIEAELKNYFDSNNIEYISQYKSDLYPFCCDFYFPDKDLYVEIQGCWTHGGKPYIETDPDCIKQLELWKSKNTKFYNSAIDTWTIRDVKKRETAKINNLNWVEIFSCDLKTCLDIILNYL